MNYYYFIFCLLFAVWYGLYYAIRRKLGFWFEQPVYHVYQLHYLFYRPRIIEPDITKSPTQYIDHSTIQTCPFSDYNIDDILTFITPHYLNQSDNKYLPKSEHIVPYFSNHSSPSFVSVCNRKKNTNTTTKDGDYSRFAHHRFHHSTPCGARPPCNIVGIITSRPLSVYIYGVDSQTLYANYIDYLCVQTSLRKTGIAARLIQTHEHNQRTLHPAINVSVFKREEELTPIVPICAYNTYGFMIQSFITHDCPTTSKIIKRITTDDAHDVIQFIIREEPRHFTVTLRSSIENLVHLIDTKNIILYAIYDNDAAIVGVYVFRHTCVEIVDAISGISGKTVSCIGSICTSQLSPHLFIESFYHCIQQLSSDYVYLAIEQISHNHHIIDDLLKNNKTPFVTSPTAYYFYNFLFHTVSSSRVFSVL